MHTSVIVLANIRNGVTPKKIGTPIQEMEKNCKINRYLNFHNFQHNSNSILMEKENLYKKKLNYEEIFSFLNLKKAYIELKNNMTTLSSNSVSKSFLFGKKDLKKQDESIRISISKRPIFLTLLLTLGSKTQVKN